MGGMGQESPAGTPGSRGPISPGSGGPGTPGNATRRASKESVDYCAKDGYERIIKTTIPAKITRARARACTTREQSILYTCKQFFTRVNIFLHV